VSLLLFEVVEGADVVFERGPALGDDAFAHFGVHGEFLHEGCAVGFLYLIQMFLLDVAVAVGLRHEREGG
jgi:hypothetical protein